MSRQKTKPRLPPRWFIRLFWFSHRRLYRLTGGRLGLWRPKPNGWGGMYLRTVGRRTGKERNVMIGYFQDGQNLVTMAMNGWGEGEPAWWLNLQAHPDVQVDLPDGTRLVTGRAAQGEERERLWSRWREIDKDLDAYAARRSTETAVVILEPRPDDQLIGR
jgi:deazaflavin-dependent oxidoreductase (nitroreductase family)